MTQVNPNIVKDKWTPEEDRYAPQPRVPALSKSCAWFRQQQPASPFPDFLVRSAFNPNSKLTQLVLELGIGKWATVARHLPGRTDQQCMVSSHATASVRLHAHRADGASALKPAMLTGIRILTMQGRWRRHLDPNIRKVSLRWALQLHMAFLACLHYTPSPSLR